jgi:hypothetical protein
MCCKNTNQKSESGGYDPALKGGTVTQKLIGEYQKKLL